MSIKYIFLDIDGVLNNHDRFDNSYSGISSRNADEFNRLLKHLPDTKIVISSAWRYLILCDHMTLTGFENMLLTHGLNVRERIIGHTREDKEEDELRINEIKDWLKVNDSECENWIAIDDMFLSDDKRCYRTNERIGLTTLIVDIILTNAGIKITE